ncbi:MAG: sulfotransferase [Chloroflexi bacterium]|nr:sulfotransferase [Chloroflexota bacterium]
MDKNLSDYPVFIGGHPKSGTSLVRSLLDAHPQLVVYPEESMFFRRFLPETQGCSLEEKLALADRLLTHIFEWSQSNPPPHQAGMLDRDYSDVPVDGVRQEMRRLVSQQYRHDGDLLSAAVLAFGRVTGKINENTLRWVEKNPFNEYYCEQIFKWWPNALFIHVVRDPRDNFVSYQRKHTDWSAVTFSESWSRSTYAGLSNQEKYGTEHYWILRYEELTESPEKTLSTLCRFIGIENHSILRIPTRNGNAWQGNSMFADKFQDISTSARERWRNKMSIDDLVIVEGLAGPIMRQIRYEVTSTRFYHAHPKAMMALLRANLSRKRS